MATSNILMFHKMLVDDYYRTGLYKKAIMQTVKDGDVVIDIGTGTGILALFACYAGAKRVYAVEREDTIGLAKQLVRENGFNKKVIFIKSDIEAVNIKEKADVIVSELISNFGIGQGILRILTESRNRFLKDSSRIIPATLEMYLVPVQEENLYKRISFSNNKYYKEKYNINFSCFRKMSVNNVFLKKFRPQNFLAHCKKIYNIDFHNNTKNEGTIKSSMQFSVSRKGVFHGFCGFFRSCLVPGVWLTNKPISSSAWTNVFFPIEEPVNVNVKDKINVKFTAFESKWEPLYRWKTSITSIKTRKRLRITKEFEQSNLLGRPLSLDTFLDLSYNYLPSLSGKGKEMVFLLNLCDGKMSLRDIARKIHNTHFKKNKNLTGTIEDIKYLIKTYHVNGLLEHFTEKDHLHT